MIAPLHRLIYFSRNHIAGTREDHSGEIRRILATSQRRNREVDVTGALMFSEGCFGQVLEGPAEAVEDTFERIQCDPRHGNVTMLAFEAVPERAFPHWSMAYVGDRTGGAEHFGDIAAASGFDPARMAGDELLSLLLSLAREDEAA